MYVSCGFEDRDERQRGPTGHGKFKWRRKISFLLRCRSLEGRQLKEITSRHQLILVTSLLDRIPNLAGLARTCEVFKVSGLAVADANVVHNKQFQLISRRGKEGIPVDIIHFLDACIEIPQLGVRSLNVHVGGAIAVWEYTRQQRSS
ncbi:tRNA (guanosine(18)-2'-O)-methyltransferase-like [Malus sylvestris]|uniref:tRNA (guanosine(18)-2'-O)-methyltransferase-like n=1 Tax=Malus sylvestris TaxID=3752 RepID=UPI0021AD49EF|nr:tRNA (guanosine(18)-2'-O)-methyltransferase-like [Malus sylvestris]